MSAGRLSPYRLSIIAMALTVAEPIDAGDGELAARRMREHLDNAEARIITRMRQPAGGT
ncbi:hypothetical protein [Pseudonocardia sp. DLS-67]